MKLQFIYGNPRLKKPNTNSGIESANHQGENKMKKAKKKVSRSAKHNAVVKALSNPKKRSKKRNPTTFTLSKTDASGKKVVKKRFVTSAKDINDKVEAKLALEKFKEAARGARGEAKTTKDALVKLLKSEFKMSEEKARAFADTPANLELFLKSHKTPKSKAKKDVKGKPAFDAKSFRAKEKARMLREVAALQEDLASGYAIDSKEHEDLFESNPRRKIVAKKNPNSNSKQVVKRTAKKVAKKAVAKVTKRKVAKSKKRKFTVAGRKNQTIATVKKRISKLKKGQSISKITRTNPDRLGYIYLDKNMGYSALLGHAYEEMVYLAFAGAAFGALDKSLVKIPVIGAYLESAKSKLNRFGSVGTAASQVALPALAAIGGLYLARSGKVGGKTKDIVEKASKALIAASIVQLGASLGSAAISKITGLGEQMGAVDFIPNPQVDMGSADFGGADFSGVEYVPNPTIGDDDDMSGVEYIANPTIGEEFDGDDFEGADFGAESHMG